MKFRCILLFFGLLIIELGLGYAQHTVGTPNEEQDTSDLLSKLRSKHWEERSDAIEKLRSHPGLLRNIEVRAGLIKLLDFENIQVDIRLAKAEERGYPDQTDNEAWAEYYSDLADAVDSFANWNDQRQACILVNAVSSDDSAFAAEIADHSKTTISCLIKRSRSKIAMNRAVVIPVLVQAVGRGRGSIDPHTLETAQTIIRDGLREPDEAIRAFTVHALGKYGTADMIPALKEVADNDPAPEIDGHSIRKSAAEAIAAIQQRAGQ